MTSNALRFIASVEEGKKDQINTIAGKLAELGCQINHVLPLAGIISGSLALHMTLDNLKIEGIKEVEHDRHIEGI